MSRFAGARIALLEARMSSEMADLIRRNGGEPRCVPAVREVPVDSAGQVSALIDALTRSSIQAVVFYTGVGATALLQEAERLGRLSELLTALHSVTVVCRGPKPSAVLKRCGVPVSLSAQEPYTTHELLQVMLSLQLANIRIAVLHYGERNTFLAQALREHGAHLEELCLYEWLPPEDSRPLQALVHDIIAAHVDAVVFTSQIQARHLLRIAEDLGSTDALISALNTRTIVASIGPTCTAILHSLGITPHVEPIHPKMGHLIKALVEHMA